MATRTDFNVISLCAGGGGLDLGIRLAVPVARTVCYVEHDVTEAGVLGKGIEAGALDDAPIWSDLLTFDSRAWRGRVDCVAGGFPCQPHSFAGKRLGEFDPRNLWPAVARVVFDVAPDVCFFENVPGILAYYWRDIRPDLQALGYEVAEGIFSAEAVGAPHLRERLYFMAYRKGARSGRLSVRPGEPRFAADDARRSGEAVAIADSSGRRAGERDLRSGQSDTAWRGEELAHALDGAGGTQQQQQHGQRADVAGRGGAALADAAQRRPYDAQQRRHEAPVRPAAEAGGELVNPFVSRCEGAGARRTCGRLDAPGRPFPPGPGDADGWARWLRDRPGTEPAVRRGSDGLAWRADRLRVLGNGVVPVVAADAFLTLAARLGVEP